jgi:hypothetical protein
VSYAVYVVKDPTLILVTGLNMLCCSIVAGMGLGQSLVDRKERSMAADGHRVTVGLKQ